MTATFERSSRWLKLALLEVHMALVLLLFPLTAASGLTSGPIAVLCLTCFLLLCACALTYTWVFIREVHNNRIIHMGAMISDFLVGIFGIVSVVVVYQWDDSERYDNVIEASIGVSILAFMSGMFAVWEMQEFQFKLPSFRRSKKNKITVEQAKQGEAVDTVTTKVPAAVTGNGGHTGNSADPLSDNRSICNSKDTEGIFSKTSISLKYAWYAFVLSFLFSFLPTEPIMAGGTREVTTLVYLCSVINLSLLFSWVFMADMHTKKALHIVSAVLTFLTAFLCILTMILWLVAWTMIHTFTPILVFIAGILACLSGAAVVVEIRQLKPRSSRGYLDKEWAASCFSGVLRAFHIDGVTVNVDENNDKSSIVNGAASIPLEETKNQGSGAGPPGGPGKAGSQNVNNTIGSPDFTPDALMVTQQEERIQKEAGDKGGALDDASPPGYDKVDNANKYRELRKADGGGSEGRPSSSKQLRSHDPSKAQSNKGMPPVSGMGEEQPKPGFNPFDEGD